MLEMLSLKRFLVTLTTDENGNTNVAEVKAGTVYIKELTAPSSYKVDETVYSLNVGVGETATLKVSDTPKSTDILIERFKIDMEIQKDNHTTLTIKIATSKQIYACSKNIHMKMFVNS